MKKNAYELNWGRLQKLDFGIARWTDPSKHWGLYQICGHHPIYKNKKDSGDLILLYVGIAFGDESSFGKRFADHRKKWLKSPSTGEVSPVFGDVRVRVTTAIHTPTSTISHEELKAVEQALVYTHMPAMNGQDLRAYNGPSIEIANIGTPGHLNPLVQLRR